MSKENVHHFIHHSSQKVEKNIIIVMRTKHSSVSYFTYRITNLDVLNSLISNSIILRIKAFLATNNSTFIVYKYDKCCVFYISLGYLMILTKNPEVLHCCCIAEIKKHGKSIHFMFYFQC